MMYNAPVVWYSQYYYYPTYYYPANYDYCWSTPYVMPHYDYHSYDLHQLTPHYDYHY